MSRLNLTMYDVLTQDSPDILNGEFELDIDSPAMSVFTTCHDGGPMLLNSDLPALEALKLLKEMPNRPHYVINAQHRFQGVIEFDNLSSEEFIKRTAYGYTREELLVADFMIPRKSLRAFDVEELKQAKVKDVVESLEHTGAKYCLAVDRFQHFIHGVASRSEIEHALNTKINDQSRSILQMVNMNL